MVWMPVSEINSVKAIPSGILSGMARAFSTIDIKKMILT
jgi:hypothetical protein